MKGLLCNCNAELDLGLRLCQGLCSGSLQLPARLCPAASASVVTSNTAVGPPLLVGRHFLLEGHPQEAVGKLPISKHL